ncbi:hypothetical protein PsAD2_01485 [Pseudovibrio axinellae]|uniref:Uncharacterized protein n=1 Tax=Pseudovibrio axinellae TaxID=989403 RepID=A0A165ZR34_9HYPH|nr:hypothetical protein PsAD2_01485 [Pseudovibrio axinellae]SEQ60309.1 hypothetical protein SAMN05421798_103206 [Pseudovibrio axinellae]
MQTKWTGRKVYSRIIEVSQMFNLVYLYGFTQVKVEIV